MKRKSWYAWIANVLTHEQIVIILYMFLFICNTVDEMLYVLCVLCVFCGIRKSKSEWHTCAYSVFFLQYLISLRNARLKYSNWISKTKWNKASNIFLHFIQHVFESIISNLFLALEQKYRRNNYYYCSNDIQMPKWNLCLYFVDIDSILFASMIFKLPKEIRLLYAVSNWFRFSSGTYSLILCKLVHCILIYRHMEYLKQFPSEVYFDIFVFVISLSHLLYPSFISFPIWWSSFVAQDFPYTFISQPFWWIWNSYFKWNFNTLSFATQMLIEMLDIWLIESSSDK